MYLLFFRSFKPVQCGNEVMHKDAINNEEQLLSINHETWNNEPRELLVVIIILMKVYT